MSEGAKSRLIPCLLTTIIIGLGCTGSVMGDSASGGMEVTWDDVLGSPKIGEGQAVLLIYKPAVAVSGGIGWSPALSENRSASRSHVPIDFYSDLTELGIHAIEDYPAFVATLASTQTAEEISKRGYHVEMIQHSTIVGKGAFSHDFRMESPNVPSDFQQQWRGKELTYTFLMKLLAPPLPKYVEELGAMGVEILDSEGSWTYLVRMKGSLIPRVSGLYYVSALEPYHYVYSVSNHLVNLILDRKTSANHRVTAMLEGMPSVSRSQLESDVSGVGGKVLSAFEKGTRCVVYAEVDIADLLDIVRLGNVRWIEPAHFDGSRLLNDLAVGILQSGTVGNAPVHDIGIQGDNQLVTVCDSGIWMLNPAFEDTPNDPGPDHRKIHALYTPTWSGGNDGIDDTGHGSYVAGVIAGDNAPHNVYSQRDGHAFESRLIVQDIHSDATGVDPPPPGFRDTSLFDPAANQGSMIHTNSWGCDHGFNPNCPNWYAQEARDNDEYMFDNDDFLILFAAGNTGELGTGTLTAEAIAKNIITVGGTGNGPNADDMYKYSGRGPTDDGRLKPTLVAPAVDICSTRGGVLLGEDWIDCNPPDPDYYEADLGGTSIATPAVAGLAALVREYFEEGWYPTGEPVDENGFGPSAALVKATLIASAEEISGTGSHSHQYRGMDFPNVDQGWGRVNLDNALYFRENNDHRRLFVVDERGGFQGSGEWLDYSFFVGDRTVPLKIVLVWTDAEHRTGCDEDTPCLMDNLNLEVTDPGGHVYRGNVFQGSNPGQSVTGGSFDNLNVEEVVLDYSPWGGRWHVHVVAETIDSTVQSQPFALVVIGGITHERHGGFYSGSANPSVATDSQGYTHVAWVQTISEFDRDIWYSRYDEDRGVMVMHHRLTWDEDADGADQFGPVIAVSPVDDAIYVVYANRNVLGGLVTYYLDGKKSVDGGYYWDDIGTAMPGYIFQSSLREIVDRADPLDLYIDASGHLHLTWKSFYDQPSMTIEQVMYAQSEDGGSTWPVEFLNVLYTDYEFSPMVFDYYNKLRYPKVAKGRFDAASGSVYVHAIFSYDATPEPIGGPYVGPVEIKYARSTDDGENWGGSVRLADTSPPLIGRYNDLAAGENSPSVVAVWEDTYNPEIYYKTSLEDGNLGSWLYSGQVNGPISAHEYYPAIQMDSSGCVHLVYGWSSDGTAWNREIYFLSSIDGGVNWNKGTRVTSFDGESSQPAIALNRRQTFEIVWTDDREGSQHIHHTTLPFVSRASFQSRHSHNPSVAVDTSGTAHMVWVDNREGDWDIFYARFDDEGRRTSIDMSLTDDFDDENGDEQFGPVVAIAPDDSIYVVFAYREEIAPTNLGYYLGGRKSTNGGNDWTTFFSPGDYVYFSSHPSGYREIVDKADPIDLYIDSLGHLHLIWTQIYDDQAFETYEQVNYMQSENGGSAWSSSYGLYEEVYFEPSYRHYNRLRYPKVAKGQTSGFNEFVHAIFSWEDDTDPISGPFDGLSEIRYVRSASDGAVGTWEPVRTIGSTTSFGRFNDLAADESDSGVIAVWHDYSPGSNLYDVFYARDTDNGNWWIDSGVIAGSSDHERWPVLALDRHNHLHVLFSKHTGGGANEIFQTALLYLSAPSPTAWSTGRQLTFPWGGDVSEKRCQAATTAPSGTLLVSWQDPWGSSADWTEIYILRAF